jgi:diacylglycerol kinase family enzyme
MEASNDRPIPILVNSRAGRNGARTIRRIEMALKEQDRVRTITGVDWNRIGPLIDELRDAGCPVIGVSGGDGSLASAADRLAGTPSALLPVPTGTLNHFSRRVGIDTIEASLRAMRDGGVESFPIGFVDDRVFLNTATFGLYADVVRRREKIRPLLTKWPAAAIAFLGILMRLRTLEVVIQVEGEYLRRSTALLWVGIGWGSFPRVIEAPEKRTSPDLEIVVLHSRTRLGAMALMARVVRHLLRGERPVDDPALEVIHARRLLIHAPHPIDITLDGEIYRCDPPLFVAVQDEGLRVVCGPA